VGRQQGLDDRPQLVRHEVVSKGRHGPGSCQTNPKGAKRRLIGVTEGELRRLVRISFARVAEYQRRGAVHFHVSIRLDAATDCGCPGRVAPPPAGFTADLLEAAVRKAAATVAVPRPLIDEDDDVNLTACWVSSSTSTASTVTTTRS
jgi:hypothetical protein